MAKKTKKNELRETWIAFSIFLLLAAAIVVIIVIGRTGDSQPVGRETMDMDYMEEAPESPFAVENFQTLAGCPLGKLNDNLSLSCVGLYGDTLAVIVENIGDELVEFAEVKINYGGMDAFFPIEDLPAGSSMLCVESQDMLYGGDAEFKTPLVLGYTAGDKNIKTSYASDFELNVENGILTLENCSGRDFEEPVEILCKSVLTDGLYFGATTLLATEGLFANGESRYFNFDEGARVVCLRYAD